MRVVLLCVVLALCMGAGQAKLVSVQGQGVIRSTPPPNVLDKEANGLDQSSEFKNGQLAITAFDEQIGLAPPFNIPISSTVELIAGVPYDSFFLFFHINSQEDPSLRATALATFKTDNRVIGCTDSNTAEFTTSQVFGVSGTIYPLSTAALYNPNRRGYEEKDLVVGAGTSFVSNNTIGQPGDYTRCFTASCSDSQGNPCQCSASLNQCIQSSDDFKCFTDASELVALNSFQFSSTCRVSSDSIVAEFGACEEANGCKIHNGKVCLSGRGSSVKLHVTAGCDCSKTITATFSPPGGGAPTPGCLVPDTSIPVPPTPCKNSSKVLIYGYTWPTWPIWFQATFPGTTVDQSVGMPMITKDYFKQYDLVVIGRVYDRLITTAESQAAVDYLNDGGAIIALAGFNANQQDVDYQSAFLAALGIQYIRELIVLKKELSYNPNNPLTAGLAPGYVDFVGGWASTPYTGPGTSEFFASGVSDSTSPVPNKTYWVGQTVILPSGGRLVTWGDEWITYSENFGLPGNVDGQFWKNAVAWVSKICVPPPNPAPCENKFVVSSSCETATHSSTGKGFALSFSNSASNCN